MRAQALAGLGLGVEGPAVHRVRHAEGSEFGPDLLGVVLRQVAAVIRGAVRIVEPHVVTDAVDAMRDGRRRRAVSKVSRTGCVVPAVMTSERSSVPGVWVPTMKIVDRPRLGQA